MRAGRLNKEDLYIRRVIVANKGRLVDAAEELGWPYSRLSERMRRVKQATWWAKMKLHFSQLRQREGRQRSRERAEERRKRDSVRQWDFA